MNQIKNQLHVNPPGESGDINSRFGQHGVSTASAGNDSISHLVDSKSNRNNIGIRDRTNEQSLAFQAYQQQVQKSIYDVSSPSAYVNPSSISQQQQLANHSLIQNGTTYFQMEQHNRNKY